MSSRQPGRSVARSVSLAGLAAAGLVLSGCGASTGIHPGAAAVIGDESLSMSKIDATATRYCQAYEPQISQQSQRVPMRYLRQFVAANLSQRLLGQQLAAGSTTCSRRRSTPSRSTKVEQQFASPSSTLRDAVVDVEAGGAYLSTVQVAIGQKLLAGVRPANPTAKAALQRGQVATAGLAEGPLDQHRPGLRHLRRRRPVQGRADQTSYPLSALALPGRGRSRRGAARPRLHRGARPSQVCG